MKILNLLTIITNLAHAIKASDSSDFLIQNDENVVVYQNKDNFLRHLQEANEATATCKRCKVVEVVFQVLGNSADENPQSQGFFSTAASLWTDSQIESEMNNINSKWKDTPFRFRLRDVVRTFNDEWYRMDGREKSFSDEVVSNLRIGGRTTINIFLHDGFCTRDPATGVVGAIASKEYDEFLWPVDTYSSKDYILMCSKITNSYNEDLIVHELGHWLGLLHTFEGDSCDTASDGDFVDDTPQMINVHPYECIKEQNSCQELPGNDPIDNYMSYSSCKNKRFTEGQKEKMYIEFLKFRERKEPCAIDEATIDIEILFDSFSHENTLTYSTWGTENPQKISLLSSEVDYSNKIVKSSHCLPHRTMFEYEFTDSSGNGLEAPGYISYSLNGREVYRQTYFGERSSVLVYSDEVTCQDENSRVTLELQFDKRPHQKEWKIMTSTGDIVADQTFTTAFGKSAYYINWGTSRLIFDRCFPFGDYTFQISDTDSRGIDEPGFYKLYVGDYLIHVTLGADPDKFKSSETVSFTLGTRDPSLPFFCFSGSTKVQTKGRGVLPMSQVRKDEMVHIGDGVYEPIYSFGHYSPDISTEFLEIQTENASLQLTKDHMVFTTSAKAIPAAKVNVGDELLGGNGDKMTIQAIKSVTARGVYAPFTPSGKIAVEGIIASTYISFDPNLSAFGIKVSSQWISHSFEFPHRLKCHYLGKCLEEEFNDTGISMRLSYPLRLWVWLLSMHGKSRSFFIDLCAALFILFNILEFAILNPLIAGVGLFGLFQLARLGHSLPNLASRKFIFQ